MLNILENVSLRKLNTFKIDESTRYFFELNAIEQLSDLFSHPLFKANKIFILGGGSNILLTEFFNGLVIKNKLLGIKVLEEKIDSILLKVYAGESWHQFVLFCIEKNYQGIENLSLIPGTVGAAPIQNIGAYGTEICDVFDSLDAFNLITGKIEVFSKKHCQFSYRDSLFKSKENPKHLVLSVNFRLNKNTDVNLREISNHIIRTRQTKLPNPQRLANGGSFFKNPIISEKLFLLVQKNFPDLVFFHLQHKRVKLSAAWLIEQCGYKGKRFGDTGVYDKHALVLVNYGDAKGEAIKELSEKIKNAVKIKFSIDLEQELVQLR